MNRIADEHRPSRHRYFDHLAAAPPSLVARPAFLGALYLHYQAAMHATRAMVYRLPHLDRPSLRIRKCRIYQQDDGVADSDTRHHQLSQAFRNIGAAPPLDDDEFGDLDDLAACVGGTTAQFIRVVQRLYPRSLGPWCLVEFLSDDWMRALAQALGAHFPSITAEPYFADVLASDGGQDGHGQEALDITGLVLAERPQLLELTLGDARSMARAVGDFWTGLDAMLMGGTDRARPAP